MQHPPFTLKRSRLSVLEQRLAERRDAIRLEQVARTRRWLDRDDDRPLFAEAAERLEQAWADHDSRSPDSWAWAGGLRHLAGEHYAAQRALQQALADGTDWEPMPQGAAGVMYLLGEFGRGADHAPGDPEGILAAAARDSDVGLVVAARERWLAWKRLARSGPHQERGPQPLTGWDWIEETFRLESELRSETIPSHVVMLRRTGLLCEHDDGVEAQLDGPVPRPGLRMALGANGEPPTLEVLGEHLVRLVPASGHTVDIARDSDEDGWGVRYAEHPDDEGEWILGMSEPNVQGATLRAADWFDLHGRPRIGEELRRLIDAHDSVS